LCYVKNAIDVFKKISYTKKFEEQTCEIRKRIIENKFFILFQNPLKKNKIRFIDKILVLIIWLCPVLAGAVVKLYHKKDSDAK
jgi:hypothetical protein